MKENNCDIVKDLLPLYVDGVLSENSKDYVDTHLKDCEDCKKEYLQMTKNIEIPMDTNKEILDKVDKKIKNKNLFIILVSLSILISVFIGAYNLMQYQWVIPYSQESMKVESLDNGELNIVYKGKSNIFSSALYKINIDGEETLVIGVNYLDSFLDKWLQRESRENINKFELYNEKRGIDSRGINDPEDLTIKDVNDFETGEYVKFDKIKVYYLDREVTDKELNDGKDYLDIILDEGHLIYEK